MTDRRRHAAPLALAIAAITVIAACSGSAGATSVASQGPVPTSVSSPSRAAAPTPAASAGPSSPGSSSVAATAAAATAASGVVLTQAWATVPLVDVATGETFRIADHAGKVVILETMAIWCSNCRSQQRDVRSALARLPADKVVFVVLDTDKSENDASLAAYRTRNGFVGRYAVAGNDVARALAADFGDEFLNPPSTPMLIIGTDGTVTRTEFGHKSVDDIVALAEANGA